VDGSTDRWDASLDANFAQDLLDGFDVNPADLCRARQRHLPASVEFYRQILAQLGPAAQQRLHGVPSERGAIRIDALFDQNIQFVQNYRLLHDNHLPIAISPAALLVTSISFLYFSARTGMIGAILI